MGNFKYRASAAIGATAILLALSSYAPLRLMWGLNHLQFLPPAFHVVCWSFLFLSAASLWLGDLHVWNTMVEIADQFLFGPRILPFACFAIALLAVFWWMRSGTHFLGDGYTLISVFGQGDTTIFRWTEPGSVYLIRFIEKFQKSYTQENAIRIFQVLSVLSGGVFLWSIRSLARSFATGSVGRLLVFCTFLFSGVLALFFGYIEYYPFLWALVAVLMAASTRCLLHGKSFVWPLLLFMVGVSLHLQLLVFGPALAYLLIRSVQRNRAEEKVPTALILSITLTTIAVSIAILIYSWSRLSLATIFLPLLTGRPAAPDYAALSLPHLLELANLVLLVFPGALLPILLISRSPGPKQRDDLTHFLLCGSVSSLLFLLLIDPSLGMPRDWDLMSMTLLMPFLLLVRIFLRRSPSLPPGLPITYGALCLALLVPFLGSVLYTPAAEARMLDILRYNKGRNNTGWSVLASYYIKSGQTSRADDILSEMRLYFPDEAMLAEAHVHLSKGEYEKALPLAESLFNKDPYRSDYVQVLGTALWRTGNLAFAIEVYRDAIALRPWFVQLKNDLGQVLIQAQQYDSAIAILNEGRNQDPTLYVITESIALAYISQRNWDSASAQAGLLLASPTDQAGGHLVTMVIAIRRGDLAKARSHFHSYLELGTTRSDYENIKKSYAWLEHSDHP
ncbi:MAG: tetratricopeptide repeat protein [Candidatus Zixiibacteriota bacterium]